MAETVSMNLTTCERCGYRWWLTRHTPHCPHCVPANYRPAYVANLIAGMERTRAEVKLAISALMDIYETSPGTANGERAYKTAAMLHRTVGSITDDLNA